MRLIHKEVMASSTDGLHYSEPWDLPVKGKIGGMIDTHNEPQIPEFDFNGQKYRYLAAIEEGAIYLIQRSPPVGKNGRGRLPWTA